jgi:hypothetical protein
LPESGRAPILPAITIHRVVIRCKLLFALDRANLLLSFIYFNLFVRKRGEPGSPPGTLKGMDLKNFSTPAKLGIMAQVSAIIWGFLWTDRRANIFHDCQHS